MRELPVFADQANLVEREEEADAIELGPDEGSWSFYRKSIAARGSQSRDG